MSESIKIPKESSQTKLAERIRDEDDLRFPTITTSGGKNPKWEIPAPTDTDADATNTEKSFKAVVLHFNRFTKKPTDEVPNPKEQRILFILRPGRITPEQLFVNNSSTKAWLNAISKTQDETGSNRPLGKMLWEFTPEPASNPAKGFKWTKVAIRVDTLLAEAEQEYCIKLGAMLAERQDRYRVDPQAQALEDSLLGVENDETHARKTARGLDEEDEAEEPKKPPTTKKPAAKKPAAKPVASDEEEGDAVDKLAKGAAVEEEEEE